MARETRTEPIDINALQNHAPNKLVIAPVWKDPSNGATYVHQDLLPVQAPWAEEAHIKPMAATERFGDLDSFVSYVKRFATSACLITWNSQGFQAVLDYAASATDTGRRQWIARQPFQPSQQWLDWTKLANGQAVNQRAAVERLEDLADDIKVPTSTDLMNLLRSLRASVNAKADTELRADGTTSIAFSRDTAVKSGTTSVDLPPFFTIAIPVLKGHTDDAGRPVLYGLQVRLRVSVDDSAHLTFRFSIPNAERTLEDVYGDRVKAAKALLDDSLTLLRAAD